MPATTCSHCDSQATATGRTYTEPMPATNRVRQTGPACERHADPSLSQYAIPGPWCIEHQRYEDSEAHDLARQDEYEAEPAPDPFDGIVDVPTNDGWDAR